MQKKMKDDAEDMVQHEITGNNDLGDFEHDQSRTGSINSNAFRNNSLDPTA